MVPSPWRRRFAGLYLVWFATLVAAPAVVHRCPIHDLPPVPASASMAPMAHGHGTAHEQHGSAHDHSSPHGHHHCNCLDASCAAGVVALAEPAHALVATATAVPGAPPRAARAHVAPESPGLRLPYSNGPPPLA